MSFVALRGIDGGSRSTTCYLTLRLDLYSLRLLNRTSASRSCRIVTKQVRNFTIPNYSHETQQHAFNMPVSRGFDISVEGVDGTPFTTYGTRSRGQTVYTHIEAEDGARFQVRVKPQAPFPEPSDVAQGPERQLQYRYSLRSSTQQQDVPQDTMDCDDSHPAPKTERPFEYFADVYIDGNKKSENNEMIVTDPDARWYEADGSVLRGRLCSVDDTSGDNGQKSDLCANFNIFPWMFTKKGIEILLGRMSISKEEADFPPTDMEQELADLTAAMAEDNLSESRASKRGQIEVVISRHICEEDIKPSRRWWGKSDEASASTNDDENTHHITIDSLNNEQIRFGSVKTRRYRPDEDWYTKVVVSYHDRAKLVNLGMAHPDGTPKSRGTFLPTLSASPESPLKRIRDSESAPSKSNDTMSSDNDESPSESSDSDVPRKRRGTIGSSKGHTKPRNKNKVLTWKARKAADEASNALVFPQIEVNGEGAEWLQLEAASNNETSDAASNLPQLIEAETDTTNAASAIMELAKVDQGNITEIHDGANDIPAERDTADALAAAMELVQVDQRDIVETHNEQNHTANETINTNAMEMVKVDQGEIIEVHDDDEKDTPAETVNTDAPTANMTMVQSGSGVLTELPDEDEEDDIL